MTRRNGAARSSAIIAIPAFPPADMTRREIIFSYTNEQAIQDGTFIDVTPKSRKKSPWRWIVTQAVHEALSMAAIIEAYNDTVAEIKKRGRIETHHVPYKRVTFNDAEYWVFIEPRGNDGLYFKIITPSDY
jgi:hypothetical protein